MSTLFRWTFCILFLACFTQVHAAQPLNKIILQLPWHHQFQFAGYYAAIEQDYYKDAGFDVTLVSGSPERIPVSEVLSDRAQYGVARSELLLHRLMGKPVVALAAIFQHSAIILIARKDSGISTPHDMIGRKVMLLEGNEKAEYMAIFQSAGVPLDEIKIISSSFNIQDLILGKTDVFNAYITNEPFVLEEQGVPYTIVSPRDYNINFYGDTLFTSEAELAAHPDQVQAFREASIRGWEYALSHHGEIIELLISKYKVSKSKSHLRYEADNIDKLILPGLVEIGHMLPERWKQMADTFVDLGMVNADYSIDGFVYNPVLEPDYTWVYWSLGIIIFALILTCSAVIVLTVFNRRITKEITERKQAEESMKKAALEWSTAIDASEDAIFILDVNRRILTANRTFYSMTGSTPKTAIGRFYEQIVHPLGADSHCQVCRAQKEKRDAVIIVEADHSENLIGRPIETTIRIVRDEQDKPLSILMKIHDLTEQRKIEDELHRGKQQWVDTFDAMSDIVTIQDKDLLITRANKAAHEFFQEKYGALNGRHCYEVFTGTLDPCPACPLFDTLQNLGNHSEIIHHKNLGKFFQVSSSAITDDKGDIQYLVHVARDVTKQKKLEEDLFQAHKMEAIGTLAGGVAHDFNNILSAIIGFSELAKDSIPPDNSAQKDIDIVLKSSMRAADLVKQILTFGRKSTQQLQSFMPHLIVKEALKMLRSSLPATLSLEEEIDIDCGLILADPTNIHQIVVNLCTNAFHAMENEKGTLTVNLSRKNIRAENIPEGDVAPGPFVILSVSDTGHGMVRETVERIFEPYFTTKEIGHGTGLGLAVIYGIVKDYSGFIEVESEIEKGTTFHVYFPALEKVISTEKITAKEPLPTGTERILLIDDESSIVDLQKTILDRLGYTVTATTDSREALEKIRLNPGQFDLIITDQTMPALSGVELAKEVLTTEPNMPIILCTGYSSVVTEEGAFSIGIKAYLRKPVTRRTLAEAVRQALDQNERQI